MRWANPPTTSSRSASISINHKFIERELFQPCEEPVDQFGGIGRTSADDCDLEQSYFSTPVTTMPWTKKRWATKNRMMGRMSAMSAPAWINCGCCAVNPVEPGKGHRDRLVIQGRGQVDERAEVVVPGEHDVEDHHGNDRGYDCGIRIDHRMRSGLAPSIMADSSSSRGRVMKYWRNRKTL
ncbi:MAG: hypothetical protein MZV63_12045 [Marinilabiliales bacterium]|nr:hypothetical protein [Marinilabiliales bacterium]